MIELECDVDCRFVAHLTFVMSASRKTSDLRVFKIIVIGDSGVGKTCLTFRFCSGKFPGKTEGKESLLIHFNLKWF